MPDTSRRRTAALWTPIASADSPMRIANGSADWRLPNRLPACGEHAQNDRFDGERQRHSARPDAFSPIALDEPCAHGGALQETRRVRRSIVTAASASGCASPMASNTVLPVMFAVSHAGSSRR